MPKELQTKVRVSVDVIPAVRDQLDTLQIKGRSTSRVEVFRKALNLYELVLDQLANGGKVVVVTKEGTEEVLRLL